MRAHPLRLWAAESFRAIGQGPAERCRLAWFACLSSPSLVFSFFSIENDGRFHHRASDDHRMSDDAIPGGLNFLRTGNSILGGGNGLNVLPVGGNSLLTPLTGGVGAGAVPFLTDDGSGDDGDDN